MITRRNLLGGFAAGCLAAPAAAASDAPLRARAAGRGLFFGTAAASYQLRDDDFARALPREAAMIVPEYELKRDTLEPRPGSFDFSGADALMDFASAHNMKMRGHTLVWYAANPGWLEEAVAGARDERIFTDFIAQVMGRYKGRLHSWDVVNEALHPEEGRPGALRGCYWLKRFGPGYIDTAFHAARQADASAMLVYNDWGCEAGAPWNDAFRAATLNLLEGFRKRGTPVDALGLQGHLRTYVDVVDQKKLAGFLAAVKAMGYRILITELDVDDAGRFANIATRDQASADIVARFLDPVLDCKATQGVLTWGLTDRYLRGKIVPALQWGYLPRRLPLDPALKRKPLWQALAKAFGTGLRGRLG
jgi:endo-1,4-beta-xylanase